MPTAKEIIKQKYITENELADILNVDTKRIRDLRSHHMTGKALFIDHIKPTAKCPLYKLEDVLAFLESQVKCSFGMSSSDPDSEED